MNILLVTGPCVSLREPYKGGTESSVVGLANTLVEKGHSVDVIAKDADEGNLFKLIKLSDNSDGICSNELNQVDQEHYMSFKYGLMDLKKYDVIHYNSYVTEIYEMASLLDKPSVLTVRLPANEKLKVLYGLFVKRTGATAVSISKVMQAEWQEVFGKATPLIHNGINLNHWPMHSQRQDDYLLWYGRICDDKNPIAAIQLAKHLKRPLKIAGRIFDQNYFNQRVKPMLDESIEYVGHLSQAEISRLAANASVFISTALWNEPFGKTTVEMLASGLPVVGFTTAIPSELRKPGLSITVDSHNWRDLIELVQTVKTTKPQDCRDFASRFSLDNMTDAYVKLYKNLSKLS